MKSLIFTHKGKREVNQDFVLSQNINSDTFLMLIADGMGGYEHGKKAAEIVAKSIRTFLSTIKIVDNALIQKAVNKANLAIRQMKEDFDLKMGATIGGVIFFKNEAYCFWVGDVKIFHFKKNKLYYESHSHTLMNELLDNGSFTDKERVKKYKHFVTRSVQGEPKESQIESHRVENITNEDLFIVCSDGVHDLYDGTYIQQLLNTSNSVSDTMNIIEKGLLQDAKDNFSLILSTCSNTFNLTTTTRS